MPSHHPKTAPGRGPLLSTLSRINKLSESTHDPGRLCSEREPQARSPKCIRPASGLQVGIFSGMSPPGAPGPRASPHELLPGTSLWCRTPPCKADPELTPFVRVDPPLASPPPARPPRWLCLPSLHCPQPGPELPARQQPDTQTLSKCTPATFTHLNAGDDPES